MRWRTEAVRWLARRCGATCLSTSRERGAASDPENLHAAGNAGKPPPPLRGRVGEGGSPTGCHRLRLSLTPHRLAIGTIALAVFASLAGVALHLATGPAVAGAGQALLSPYILRVTGFTVLQAGLSTVLALLFGAATGLALFRCRALRSARAIEQLFALPLAIPALVAVLGIVTVWGANGVLARGFAATGMSPPWGSIYGLGGILLAHTFFNLPLVARVTAQALERVPDESWRLAAMLSLTRPGVFRHVEWPVVRAALPGVAGLVFLLCLTSFTIALTLGGGPATTTIEVALYQALRFDFDLALAVKLAALELAIAVGALLVLQRALVPAEIGAAPVRARAGPVGRRGWSGIDVAVVALAGLFVAAPVAAIVIAGAAALSMQLTADPAVWRALATSLAVGIAAAAIALVLGTAIATRRDRSGRRGWPLLLASLTLAFPPMLLGAGWFLLLVPLGDPARFAALAVVLANGLIAIPYVVRTLDGPIRQSRGVHDRLAANLGIAGWNRLRLIEWPVLRRPLAAALLMAMLVSLGDFGTVALFGNENFVTLPALLYQRMGNYRSADAAALALLLLVLALALTTAAGRLARERAA